MAAGVDIASLIVSSPEICHGRPRIAGTGISVHRIAWWYNQGLTPEEILIRLEHLTLAQVHAALAHYHANRLQIEADIDADQVSAEAIEREQRTRV